MGVITYRHKNTYMKRCEKCHKLSHYIYRLQLGEAWYNFCSGLCAEAARSEYDSKMKSGISPNNLEPIEEGGETIE
jgi:hypothetical protein